MNADEFRRLAEVVAAIENEGGEVEDVSVTMREQGGPMSALGAMLGGEPRVEPVFDLKVSAGEVEADPDDDPERPNGTDVPLSTDGDDETDEVFDS